MLKQLKTRVYFPGEPANATDPVLSLVPADRPRNADREAESATVLCNGTSCCRARHETVFLEY